MNYEQAFYYCKAEVEQRNRDIKRCVDDARIRITSPTTLDLLASILHHSEMSVFCFDKCEKEIERELDDRVEKASDFSIMEGMDRLKKMTEELVKETKR